MHYNVMILALIKACGSAGIEFVKNLMVHVIPASHTVKTDILRNCKITIYPCKITCVPMQFSHAVNLRPFSVF